MMYLPLVSNKSPNIQQKPFLSSIFAEKFDLLNNGLIFVIYIMTLYERKMEKYVCNLCGYIYDPAEGDPENGIAPGTPFEDIPDTWTCPACGVGKEHFEVFR